MLADCMAAYLTTNAYWGIRPPSERNFVAHGQARIKMALANANARYIPNRRKLSDKNITKKVIVRLKMSVSKYYTQAVLSE